MNTVDCVVRDGSVFFRCARCAGEQGIDPDMPFLPQFRLVTASHRCAVNVPAARAPLTLVHGRGA